MGFGYLTIKASIANEALPVKNAKVVIKCMSEKVLYTLKTDASGRTRTVKLSAPNKRLSLDINYNGMPYANYWVEVSYPGLKTEIIKGVEIFDKVSALQEVEMRPVVVPADSVDDIEIQPHVQVIGAQRYQKGPRESRPISEQAVRLQQRVFIPESITVHLGSYTNASARNIRVPFPQYIKNVASSEIYPTWPEASLEANIRAIINFALNRVYTEWYRIRGYNFDITSTTATDMYFVEGRDIFVNIGVIVDRIIGEYLRRPNHIEPFFTSFCDGKVSQCAGLLQWGTVTLANNGYTPMQILRYYYPNDLIIDTAPIAPIVESFPGVPLSQGTQGADVERMQRYLLRIRQNYPLIPSIINPNGIFGTDTANAVRVFQQVFSLPQTGIIDRATWNKITYIFVAVAKLADLNSEGDRIVTGTVPPNIVISIGASGGLVARLQFMLTYIGQLYPDIPALVRDGVFGSGTRNAVIAFQTQFGLTPDGIVNPATWSELYEVYYGIKDSTQPPYITHIVVAGDTLFSIARQFGTTVEAIRSFNNLTSDILTIGQVLLIPAGEIPEPEPPTTITHVVVAGDTLFSLAQRYGTTVAAIRALNNLTSDILMIGQVLRIPVGTAPEPEPPAYITHTVVAGDTLFLLAQRFGTTVAAIRSFNNLTSDILMIGQVLRIPVGVIPEPEPPEPPATITHVVVAGDTLFLLAQRFGTTVAAIRELNNLTSDILNIGQVLIIPVGELPEPEPPTTITHIVVAGDTLFALAQRYGTTVAAIRTQNNLTSDVLSIGQVLIIPVGGTAPLPPPQSIIVIDPGHGGADPGATNGSRLEKNDNLNMGLAVRNRLQAQGQTVIMTRSTDVFIPLLERSAISNNNNADIYVSLHRNASTNTAANGLENYVQNNSPTINITYAQNVQGEVLTAGVQSNGGVRQGNFSVLRNTQAPAMLLELGYITNTMDNQLFDQNFNAYADAIVRAIIRSLSEPFPPLVPPGFFNYVVRSGDTLSAIAQRYGTTPQAIMSLNSLASNNVFIGQVLKIPN